MFNLNSIFPFLLILIFNQYVYCDLCDLCICEEKINNNDDDEQNEIHIGSNELNNNLLTINCKLNQGGSGIVSNISTIDLKTIIWPRTNSLIIANFNSLDINILPK